LPASRKKKHPESVAQKLTRKSWQEEKIILIKEKRQTPRMNTIAANLRDAVEAASIGGNLGSETSPRHQLLEAASQLANLIDCFTTATAAHAQRDMVCCTFLSLSSLSLSFPASSCLLASPSCRKKH